MSSSSFNPEDIYVLDVLCSCGVGYGQSFWFCRKIFFSGYICIPTLLKMREGLMGHDFQIHLTGTVSSCTDLSSLFRFLSSGAINSTFLIHEINQKCGYTTWYYSFALFTLLKYHQIRTASGFASMT